jgi:hypothetical protein
MSPALVARAGIIKKAPCFREPESRFAWTNQLELVAQRELHFTRRTSRSSDLSERGR